MNTPLLWYYFLSMARPDSTCNLSFGAVLLFVLLGLYDTVRHEWNSFSPWVQRPESCFSEVAGRSVMLSFSSSEAWK